jgi:hypothetical protein
MLNEPFMLSRMALAACCAGLVAGAAVQPGTDVGALQAPESVLASSSATSKDCAAAITQSLAAGLSCSVLLYDVDGVTTGAYAIVPQKPKGVILRWHGTILPVPGSPILGETLDDHFATMASSHPERIFVMPQQLGLGETRLTQHQPWSMLKPLQDDCVAVLERVHAIASASISGKVDLFMYGMSQGGTSVAMCHLASQRSSSLM